MRSTNVKADQKRNHGNLSSQWRLTSNLSSPVGGGSHVTLV